MRPLVNGQRRDRSTALSLSLCKSLANSRDTVIQNKVRSKKSMETKQSLDTDALGGVALKRLLTERSPDLCDESK